MANPGWLTEVENNPILISAVYLAISLMGFIASRAIANFFSGPHSISGWSCGSHLFSFFWATVHMSVAKFGNLLFFAEHFGSLENNELVRWTALIAALFQCGCFPSDKKSTHWFFRSKKYME